MSGKVYVVIGVFQGVINEVRVFEDEKRAEGFYEQLKRDYGIEDALKHRYVEILSENEVKLFECEVE